MNIDRLMENIIEQIKEAQLKLGYAKEIISCIFLLRLCADCYRWKERMGKNYLSCWRKKMDLQTQYLVKSHFLCVKMTE